MEPENLFFFHKSPPLDLILGQLYSVYALKSLFSKIHCNIILPSVSSSPKVASPFRLFRLKFCVHFWSDEVAVSKEILMKENSKKKKQAGLELRRSVLTVIIHQITGLYLWRKFKVQAFLFSLWYWYTLNVSWSRTGRDCLIASTAVSYSWGPGFKLMAGDRLPWLWFLWSSLIPPGKCQDSALN
jgi:hypothetical protein